jgi:hypothetical protein
VCLQAGHKPGKVLELLSNNYHGYAQMVNLLCEWHCFLGDDEKARCPAPPARGEAPAVPACRAGIPHALRARGSKLARSRSPRRALSVPGAPGPG